MTAVIERKWNGIDVKIRGKTVVGKSAFETGLIVEGQAKALAPRKQGRLVGSITTQSRTESTRPESPATAKDVINPPREEFEVLVGTAVEYAAWVEFGTGPHQVNSPVLIPGIGWRYIGLHPGTEAQPFLRPALDLAQGKSVTILRDNARFQFKEYLKE
jgi:hypothetical protein